MSEPITIRIEGEHAQLVLDILEGRRIGTINIDTTRRVIEVILPSGEVSPTIPVIFKNPADPTAPPIEGQGRLDGKTLIVGLDPAQPGSDATVFIRGNTTEYKSSTYLNPEQLTERFFEADPEDARLRFRPLDKVKLIRPEIMDLIPVGAVGQVIWLEHPGNVMSLKSRHYVVFFDLTSYRIPTPEDWRKARAMPNAPEFLENMQLNLKVQDLELVEKGGNWRADYEHQHELDRIAQAMQDMTPADWHTNLDAITKNIMTNSAINSHMRDYFGAGQGIQSEEIRLPGVSDAWPKPETATFTPEQWVKLLVNNPTMGDLKAFDNDRLAEIQNYLEDLKRDWTPDEDKLHLNIVHEWDRREKLEPPEPTNLNTLPPAE